MAKPKNLSPKFKIPVAEKELELQMGQIPMGSQQGGLNMYSNKFKRGYGDAVFGSDENGIWLGAAEFADAPFNVDMDGALAAKSATFTDGDDVTIIDSSGLVSSASFITGQNGEVNSGIITTSSTSLVDMTKTDVIFTLDRSTVVLVILACELKFEDTTPGGGRGVKAQIHVGGEVSSVQEVRISLLGTQNETAGAGALSYVTLSTHLLRTLPVTSSPVSYTIKAQWSVSGAGITATCRNRQLSYVLFGK
jgi:hypothetical protein